MPAEQSGQHVQGSNCVNVVTTTPIGTAGPINSNAINRWLQQRPREEPWNPISRASTQGPDRETPKPKL